MAKMFLMCGGSGAGKTTFSKVFAEERGLKYLGIDEFYAIVNGDECMHTNTFEVWIKFYQAIHDAEINDISVIIDTNAITKSHRTQFVDWFPSFEHYLIYIDADPELRKVNNRSRRRQVPDDVMDQMTARLEVPYPSGENEAWRSIMYIKNRKNNFEKPIIWKGSDPYGMD